MVEARPRIEQERMVRSESDHRARRAIRLAPGAGDLDADALLGPRLDGLGGHVNAAKSRRLVFGLGRIR
jgi:hypothetical protein